MAGLATMVVAGSWLAARVSPWAPRGDPVAADPAAPAEYVTAVLRLPATLATPLQGPLATIERMEPAHYVYPPATLHLTLLQATGSTRTLEDLEADLGSIASALGRPRVAISVRGLALGPGSLVAILEPDDRRLVAARRWLRRRWHPGGRDSVARILGDEVFHATLARWTERPSPALLRALRVQRHVSSGPVPLQSIELATTNRTFAPARTTIEAAFPLGRREDGIDGVRGQRPDLGVDRGDDHRAGSDSTRGSVA